MKLCDVCGKRIWPWQRKGSMVRIMAPQEPTLEDIDKAIKNNEGYTVYIHRKCVEEL